MPENNDLLTPEELAARWKEKVGLRTLERWRTGGQKTGPAFVRLYAGGPPLYRLEDVIAWEKKNRWLTNKEPLA